VSDRASNVNWLVFLALGFMWGSSYLFIKIGVETFETFSLVAFRLAIGAVLLWAVVAVAREPVPRSPRMYGHLVVLATVSIAIPFGLITWAEQSVDSSLAAILNSTVPLFVIVIAPLVLYDEPIRVNGIVGLAVGFAGVAVLTSPGLDHGGTNLAGAVALLGSSLSYAVGGVYARRFVKGLRPMIPAVFQVTFALVIMGVLAFALEEPLAVEPDAAAIFSVVWLGLLGSGLAYLAFFRLIRSWGATRTSLVAYTLPVFGIVLGFLVLGETIDARVLAGTVLVIAGVALVNSRFGRRRIFGRTPPVEAA
jgi:drug/metabolite transporter (DMT)-like permease